MVHQIKSSSSEEQNVLASKPTITNARNASTRGVGNLSCGSGHPNLTTPQSHPASSLAKPLQRFFVGPKNALSCFVIHPKFALRFWVSLLSLFSQSLEFLGKRPLNLTNRTADAE